MLSPRITMRRLMHFGIGVAYCLEQLLIEIMDKPKGIDRARGGEQGVEGGTEGVGHFLPRRYLRYGTALSISGKKTDFRVSGK